jgi:hypothetical protein
MADQRQFRSDDTSKWQEGFGNGSAGDATNPANNFHQCTGTVGESTITYPGGWSSGWPILIHQSRGTGAGNWELNYATSSVSTTMNLKYPLCNTYATGAQFLYLWEYNNITLSSLTASAWTGTSGGIIALLARESITVSGTVQANGAASNQWNAQNQNGGGFRGGKGGDSKNDPGGKGEGTIGAGGADGTAANGNGAGGADSPTGLPGDTSGNAGLTIMTFGGAGGGSESDTQVNYNNGYGIAGGNGAGIIVLIGKTITVTGTITATGGVGYQVSDVAGSGAGAGGSILLKGKTIILGTTLVTAAGGAATANARFQGAGGGSNGTAGQTVSNSGVGGAGGVGRIHADYSLALTGSTTPTIDSTQDLTIREVGGPKFINFL